MGEIFNILIELIRKIRDKMADISIRTKLLSCFILLSVISVLFVGGFSYKSSSAIIIKQDEAYTRSILNQIIGRIEEIRDEVFKISIPLITNPSIQSNNMDSNDRFSVLEKKRDIQNILSSILFTRNNICSIFVCTKSGIIVSSGPLSYHDENNYKNYSVYKAAIDKDTDPVWIGAHENEFSLDKNRDVLTFTRALYNRDSFQSFGALIINIPVEVIEKISTNEVSTKILIIDTNGKIIFKNWDNTDSFLQDNVVVKKILEDGNSEGKFNLEKEKIMYNIQYSKSRNGDWIYIAATPFEYLKQNSSIVKKNITLILVITIVISLALSYAISSYIVIPIRKIIKVMKRVQKGEMDIDLNIKNKSETGQLSENFEMMIKEIKLLIINLNEEHKKKREAELNTLQAQITPHFVYNTLNSIKCLAVIQKEKGIEEMTSNLIELFQLSISNKAVFISINYEIEMLKKYISIQNFMHGNRYNIKYEYEDEILEYMTLKMTLQPFVENSLLHGVRQKSQLSIIIRAYKKDTVIHFEVEDNGIGMDEAQIQKVLSGENQSTRKYSGIGVKNVDERIKMHFGNNYGISFISKPDEYTIASIVIPAFKEEEKNENVKGNDC